MAFCSMAGKSIEAMHLAEPFCFLRLKSTLSRHTCADTQQKPGQVQLESFLSSTLHVCYCLELTSHLLSACTCTLLYEK